MAEKHVLVSQLRRFYTNLKGKFVAKEHKTGSESEFKVLSDNNLTDQMATKIGDAATESWVGEQGFAKTSDVTSAVAGVATETWVEAKGYATSASVDTAVGDAKTELQGKIDAAVSSAYKVKGSIAFASLPTPAKAEEGNVYNVSDAFTTTDAFVEGAGTKAAAGTNVVCVKVGSAYKWDLLAGFIDTSGFVKASDITYATDADIDALFTE